MPLEAVQSDTQSSQLEASILLAALGRMGLMTPFVACSSGLSHSAVACFIVAWTWMHDGGLLDSPRLRLSNLTLEFPPGVVQMAMTP